MALQLTKAKARSSADSVARLTTAVDEYNRLLQTHAQFREHLTTVRHSAGAIRRMFEQTDPTNTTLYLQLRSGSASKAEELADLEAAAVRSDQRLAELTSELEVLRTETSEAVRSELDPEWKSAYHDVFGALDALIDALTRCETIRDRAESLQARLGIRRLGYQRPVPQLYAALCGAGSSPIGEHSLAAQARAEAKRNGWL